DRLGRSPRRGTRTSHARLVESCETVATSGPVVPYRGARASRSAPPAVGAVPDDLLSRAGLCATLRLRAEPSNGFHETDVDRRRVPVPHAGPRQLHTEGVVFRR